MNRKPRLLVLTPRFPFPLHGGDVLRIYRLCEALRDDWELTLLSICQSDSELQAELPADSPFSTVRRVLLPRWRSYANALGALFSDKPLQVAFYDSAEFRAVVMQLAETHEAVLCHLLRTAPYGEGFNGLRLLELTDHLPLTYARSNALRGKAVSIKRLAYLIEQERTDRAQNAHAQAFDLVSFVSDVDRQMFLASSGLSAQRVVSVSNGVALEERPFAAERSGTTLAFIGNLRAMPNADAVTHFVEAVLPLVHRRHPGTRLVVIGPVRETFARHFEGQPMVQFLRAVPDIAEAAASSVIGVCPIRIGAGVQNKVLDYMALGLATVTTSLGAEGIDARADEHFLVADSAEAFAAAVVRLLDDAALRHRLAGRARSLLEERYAWRARTAAFVAHLRSLREARSGAAPT